MLFAFNMTLALQHCLHFDVRFSILLDKMLANIAIQTTKIICHAKFSPDCIVLALIGILN